MAQKIIVTEYRTPINNGEIREWRFKAGNKILARLYFPGSFNRTLFKVETRIFAYEFGTLEQAAKFIPEWIRDNEGITDFEITDKKGYSLDLLVCFEDELLKAV